MHLKCAQQMGCKCSFTFTCCQSDARTPNSAEFPWSEKCFSIFRELIFPLLSGLGKERQPAAQRRGRGPGTDSL